MTVKERETASYLLADRIIGHQWFYLADNILCFLNFGSEIDTSEMIAEALKLQKKVFVPKISGNEMDFYRICSVSGLPKGYGGIREPMGGSEKYCSQPDENVKTLMLMPGVAFDPENRRLGYGKGFYDRFLQDKDELRRHSIAVGFACQLVAKVPEEAQDIRPYQVILA